MPSLEEQFSHVTSFNDPEIAHLSDATKRGIVDHAREKQQQHVVETPQRDYEAWVHEYTKIIAQETSALVDKEIRKAINNLRTELLGQINRACDRVYAAAQKDIAAGVQRASNKLIIYDLSDPQATKHLKDDPDKVLNWDDVVKRRA